MQGKIIRIYKDKSFGFIKGEKGDYFFHRNACVDKSFDNLEVDDEVKFRPEETPKGLRAEEVELL